MKKVKKILVFLCFLIVMVIFIQLKNTLAMENSNLKSLLLPNYYNENNWLQSRLEKIKVNTAARNSASFIFITDMHFDSNSGYTSELIKQIKKVGNINYIINGGDQNRAYGNKTQLDNDIEKFVSWSNSIDLPVYITHGNHDFVTRESQTSNIIHSYSKNDTFNKLMSVMDTSKISTNAIDELYYYFDDVENKIRYIVLDLYTGDVDEKNPQYGMELKNSHGQINWLLKDALTTVSNYKFVIISHAPVDSKLKDWSISDVKYKEELQIIREIEKAINNKKSFSFTYDSVNYTYDFSKTTNHILLHINGHTHQDRSNFSDNILSVSVTCDASYVNDWDANGNKISRTKGTINEHAFDVITINFDTNKIQTIRMGARSDREWSFNLPQTMYVVKYDANGGIGAPSSQEESTGKTITLSSKIPTREGYSFIGWNTNKDASTATYQVGEKYTFDDDVTLYAIWKANDYKISYQLNGGIETGNPTSGTYNSEVIINNPIKTVTLIINSNGYDVNSVNNISTEIEFEGWTSPDINVNTAYCDDVLWSDGLNKIKTTIFKNLTANGSNVTMVANWADTKIVLPELSFEGALCVFNTKADGSGKKYNSNDEFVIDGDSDSEINLYTICNVNYNVDNEIDTNLTINDFLFYIVCFVGVCFVGYLIYYFLKR